MSSIPYILFGEHHVKLLRIILRDRFAANSKGDQFFRRSCLHSPWERCSGYEWYDGIKDYALFYLRRYTDEVPNDYDINRATRYLFHRNIGNKIHGTLKGYSIA